MKRLSNQVRQRRRQTWLDLPAHEIEEAGHGRGTAGTQREIAVKIPTKKLTLSPSLSL